MRSGWAVPAGSVASMYQRSVRSYRALRPAGFATGYLLARVGAGIPAFLLTAFVARLVNDHPAWATAVAVVLFASCGVYQLTPLKTRCLIGRVSRPRSTWSWVVTAR